MIKVEEGAPDGFKSYGLSEISVEKGIVKVHLFVTETKGRDIGIVTVLADRRGVVDMLNVLNAHDKTVKGLTDAKHKR